jgi:hypothetical protein
MTHSSPFDPLEAGVATRASEVSALPVVHIAPTEQERPL